MQVFTRRCSRMKSEHSLTGRACGTTSTSSRTRSSSTLDAVLVSCPCLPPKLVQRRSSVYVTLRSTIPRESRLLTGVTAAVYRLICPTSSTKLRRSSKPTASKTVRGRFTPIIHSRNLTPCICSHHSHQGQDGGRRATSPESRHHHLGMDGLFPVSTAVTCQKVQLLNDPAYHAHSPSQTASTSPCWTPYSSPETSTWWKAVSCSLIRRRCTWLVSKMPTTRTRRSAVSLLDLK